MKIEYEILPLRAVYSGEIDTNDEKEAIEAFRTEFPHKGRIREIDGRRVVDDGSVLHDVQRNKA